MLVGATEEACSRATGDLLQTLGTLGYCDSAKKVQIARQEVTYLGYKIRQGKRWLTQAMKETILQIPEPKTPRQVREFLGTIGYCRLWIIGFAEKARPLYEGSKETPNWTWTEPIKQAFQTLRRALLETPALALPNPNKPFQLFVDEKQGMGKGVLTQQWGPWKRLWHTFRSDWTQWPLGGPLAFTSLQPLPSSSAALTS